MENQERLYYELKEEITKIITTNKFPKFMIWLLSDPIHGILHKTKNELDIQLIKDCISLYEEWDKNWIKPDKKLWTDLRNRAKPIDEDAHRLICYQHYDYWKSWKNNIFKDELPKCISCGIASDLRKSRVNKKLDFDIIYWASVMNRWDINDYLDFYILCVLNVALWNAAFEKEDKRCDLDILENIIQYLKNNKIEDNTVTIKLEDLKNLIESSNILKRIAYKTSTECIEWKDELRDSCKSVEYSISKFIV